MDYLTQQFISITKKLRTAFDSLREHIEKISSSIDRATADYHAEKQQTVDSQPVLVEVRRSQTEIDEERTRETSKEQREARQEGRDRVRLRFELVGLVIGSTLALASVGSLVVGLISANAARDAADAAKRSAAASESQIEATKASIEATVDQFRLDQRAWVGVDQAGIVNGLLPEDGKPLVVGVAFKNTGKTPAERVALRASIRLVPKGTTPDFGYAGPYEGMLSQGIITPNTVVHITQNANGPNGVLAVGATQMLAHEDLHIFVFGRISYCDVFSVPHWIIYCYRMHPAREGGYAFGACDLGNEIDHNDTPADKCKESR